ncbi:NADH-quinone oxidoreductase subunit M [Gordonia zhaorongruii]|uniref:NADH-quinone oxidoreductase subunit M n=1 Tax=Gordonia zhaorongruii TaxID=2597659 RepID=UPI001043F87B|nr:NADH-quinone oxidoreductase subunit M [Gordonia zhaorongruii]
MTMPWLTILWLIPAVASAVIMFLPSQRAHNAKVVGLGASVLVLVWALIVTARFDTSPADAAATGVHFQMTEDISWIPTFGARYSLGLDGIGLALILLTVVLTPLLLLAGWRDADGDDADGDDADGHSTDGEGTEPARGKSVHIYVALLLAVEAMVLMSFVATDVLLFYIFFEAMLVPMYFLIGGFGKKSSPAAVRFLLYNLFGGLIMLAAVIGVYVVAGTFSFEAISGAVADGSLEMSSATENLLFLGFVFAFAVKAPLWPLHTWLPDAAVSTTPAAAVMMMAVMDKVGTFAMLRFCIGMFPEASETFAPVICTLAVISIIYGAVAAIGQRDVMRLIAYTSISHFGFIVLGVFALTAQGQSGSALYMVNHGISTAALFLIAGFLVSRRGSALIADYGGVQKIAPVLAGTFLVAGLATLSLPGLGPFISEFLVLIGTFTRYPIAAIAASVALVLSAVYILWTYQRMMGGPEPEDAGRPPITDLCLREKLVVAPLILALVALGFFPRLILDYVESAVDPAPTVARSE